MLAWLRKWLGLSQARPEGFDLYHPREREIYRYFNGKEVIAIDPMILYKRIMEVGPELDIDIKVACSPSKDASKAHESALEKTRKIFNLVPFSEGGLTEDEAFALLSHFFEFVERVKKNLKSSETYLDPSENSAISSEEPQATWNGSASGSAAKESFTGNVPSSPTEQVLPSA